MSKDTKLSSLLEFYSEKASAHASFSVAITIGFFALLTFDEVNSDVISLTFLILWAVGLYTLLNFSYYSEHAVWTKAFLVDPKHKINIRKPLDDQVFKQVRGNWENTFLRFFFLKFKKRGALSFKPRKQKPEIRKPSTYYLILYFAFSFYLQLSFFPEWNLLADTFWYIFLLLFIGDVVSIFYSFFVVKDPREGS